MTTFINGKPGIIEMITAERDKAGNRLANDLTRVDRGEVTGTLGKAGRAAVQAEIGAFNLMLAYLDNPYTFLLSEAEYAERFGPRLCGACMDRPSDSTDGYCATCRAEATALAQA